MNALIGIAAIAAFSLGTAWLIKKRRAKRMKSIYPPEKL